MATPGKIPWCVPVLTALSMLAMPGCGGNVGHGDLAGDTRDAVTVADTIADEDIPADVASRDADDVVHDDAGPDIAPPDSVVDTPSGDAGGDVAIDVAGDDVVADVACIPDCSGGACTDDGCGGDCCAPDGVCETPEGGGAPVCVPTVDGTTCMEVIECINGCIDTECAEACLNAGSATARTAFLALYDCLDENCADQGEECVNAAVGSGGVCHEDMSQCLAN